VPALVLDLETIPDPALAWEPRERDGRVQTFPPAPYWEIVAFGGLLWDSDGVRKFACLGKDGGYTERAALESFAQILPRVELLVTWNGRRFDLPVIVARCMKHRIPLPAYFQEHDMRYRYSKGARGHLDLADQLTDHGAAQPAPLDGWAKMIGLPGKGDVDGGQVAGLVAAGELERVRAYCLDDVAQTARIWLEWRYLAGLVSLEQLEASVSALAHGIRVWTPEAA
jgi:predicted PolB exonuclease-like 3'-5' exonuclease